MRFALPLVACGVVAGCASITDGTDQTLIIPVQPREARCSVVRNDVELGTITGTQQTLTISKGAKDIIVTCNAPGYLQKVSRLVSTTQTSGMMSFLFLDLGITDMVTGAMWKYPQSTSIVLERDPAYVPTAGAAPNAPSGPPPGATVNVDMNAGAMPAPPPSGKDVVVAERLARELGCATRDTVGKLLGKGPGQETYSFQCANGETLVVRCEFGNCRPLR